MTFIHSTQIRMSDTDAAGVLYFAHQLRLAHEAYEAFLDSAGLPIRGLLAGDCHLPIVHAEADFTAPLRVGDRVEIDVSVDSIGETSYKILYRFRKDKEVAVGSAQTVHVAVDAKTGRKRKLPDDLRAALKKLT